MNTAQNKKIRLKKLTSSFAATMFDWLPVILLVSGAFAVSPAHAGERQALEQVKATTLNLINLLVQEGVLSREKADALIKKAEEDAAKNAETAAATELPGDEKAVRVQYVPEIVKNQLRDEIKKEVMTKLNYKAGERLGLPDWIDRFAWEGDLRLRYQLDRFPGDNPDPVFFNTDPLRQSEIANTSEDRSRFRVRARFGTTIKINDWLTGGIRFTTGNAANPLTGNQNMETADAKYNFGLDRAYLKAKFYPWLTVAGGRFENPWFHSDLVWDPDLAFDGFYTGLTPKLSEKWSLFGTFGAFPLDEINTSSSANTQRLAKDKWLYGAQAGIQWTSWNKSTVKFGVALYDFENVEGISNGTNLDGRFDGTVPVFRQKGNNTFNINDQNGTAAKFGLASKFRELNFTGQVDLATFDPVHVILLGDYVRNIGFDANEILIRTGNSYKKENEAFQIRLTVGMPTTYKAKDWQVFGAYKRIEADAVLDGFNDSVFNLGGTDTQGWVLGSSYGVDKNAWMSARWHSTRAVSGLPSNLPLNVDVLFVDFNAKF